MMWTIFALVGVLVLTWVWVIRGFFSAFLHLLCVLAAGAVAFAVYEPLAMLMLTQAPDRGVGTILRDTAHGVSLGMSFAIALALLRVAVDKAVPANMKFNDNVEYVGAGVCGLATGILTIGFVLMSLSLMRFGPDKPVQSLVFTQEGGGARGSVVRNSNPLRPYVDEWTAGVYEWMSRGSLNTNQPLYRWHPNFHELGSAMRTSFDGRSRNASRPDEFRVVQWYALGDIDRGGNISELMRDRWQPVVNQRVIGLDGQEITNGYVAGVVVELDARAREMGGGAKVVLGNAQVRLVAEQAGTGFTRAFHPSAVISQAEGDSTQLARFRFDADQTFIATVGGAAKSIMVFDFALPRTYRPIAIYIRGVRKTLNPQPDQTFETPTQRDNAVNNFEHGGIDMDSLRTDYMITLETRRGRQALTSADYHLYTRNTLPANIQIKKGLERGLLTFKGDRDRFHFLVGGTEIFRTADLRSQFIEPNLRIAGFNQSNDVRIVQADVGRASPLALNGTLYQNVQGSPAPLLVDDRGQQYPPVGYVAVEDANTYISFTPEQPIRAFGDLPFTVSASRATQEVFFIYNVSAGVNIVAMVAGDQIVAKWEPPVEVGTSGRR